MCYSVLVDSNHDKILTDPCSFKIKHLLCPSVLQVHTRSVMLTLLFGALCFPIHIGTVTMIMDGSIWGGGGGKKPLHYGFFVYV